MATFHNAALWKRALIVLAGPVTNLLVAIVIFAAFAALIGKPVAISRATAHHRAFSDIVPARQAGLKIGDRIIAIDGKPMSDFHDVQDAVMLYPGSASTSLSSASGETRNLPDHRRQRFQEKDRFGNEGHDRYQIGVIPQGAKFDYRPAGSCAECPFSGAVRVRTRCA